MTIFPSLCITYVLSNNFRVSFMLLVYINGKCICRTFFILQNHFNLCVHLSAELFCRNKSLSRFTRDDSTMKRFSRESDLRWREKSNALHEIKRIWITRASLKAFLHSGLVYLGFFIMNVCRNSVLTEFSCSGCEELSKDIFPIGR